MARVQPTDSWQIVLLGTKYFHRDEVVVGARWTTGRGRRTERRVNQDAWEQFLATLTALREDGYDEIVNRLVALNCGDCGGVRACFEEEEEYVVEVRVRTKDALFYRTGWPTREVNCE